MNYELYHHGILGMHWGIRRYQNKDGSLTAAGKKRYKTALSAQVDRNLESISDKNRVLAKRQRGFNYSEYENKKRSVDEMLNATDKSYPDYKAKIDERQHIRDQLEPLFRAYENGNQGKAISSKIDSLRAKEEALTKDIDRMSESIAKDLLGKFGTEKAVGPFGAKTTKGEQFVRFLKYRGYAW